MNGSLPLVAQLPEAGRGQEAEPQLLTGGSLVCSCPFADFVQITKVKAAQENQTLAQYVLRGWASFAKDGQCFMKCSRVVREIHKLLSQAGDLQIRDGALCMRL